LLEPLPQVVLFSEVGVTACDEVGFVGCGHVGIVIWRPSRWLELARIP
jgi:hypothetical protein